MAQLRLGGLKENTAEEPHKRPLSQSQCHCKKTRMLGGILLRVLNILFGSKTGSRKSLCKWTFAQNCMSCSKIMFSGWGPPHTYTRTRTHTCVLTHRHMGRWTSQSFAVVPRAIKNKISVERNSDDRLQIRCWSPAVQPGKHALASGRICITKKHLEIQYREPQMVFYTHRHWKNEKQVLFIRIGNSFALKFVSTLLFTFHDTPHNALCFFFTLFWFYLWDSFQWLYRWVPPNLNRLESKKAFIPSVEFTRAQVASW